MKEDRDDRRDGRGGDIRNWLIGLVALIVIGLGIWWTIVGDRIPYTAWHDEARSPSAATR